MMTPEQEKAVKAYNDAADAMNVAWAEYKAREAVVCGAESALEKLFPAGETDTGDHVVIIDPSDYGPRVSVVAKENMLPDKQLDAYLREKPPVTIYNNDETGEQLWTVAVTGTDFWLAAFADIRDARAFCVSHGLTQVTEVHP